MFEIVRCDAGRALGSSRSPVLQAVHGEPHDGARGTFSVMAVTASVFDDR
jgi:hypothetical protein